MNTLAIGRKRERNVGDWLKKEGYIDRYWQPPQGKFGAVDIFDLFDLIAYNWSGHPIFIQVVKRSFAKGRIQAIEKFMRESGMEGYVYWIFISYKVKDRAITDLYIETTGSSEMGECEHYSGLHIPDKPIPSAR